MKKNKGFTLAEMLIVVAIIGILVAIIVPSFTAQLEKSRESADAANIRAKMSELVAKNLQDGKSYKVTVELTQKTDGWAYTQKVGDETLPTEIKVADGSAKYVLITVDKDGTIHLAANAEAVSLQEVQ